MNKIVLAYSGGLETTAALHWLTHYRRMKVVTVTVNLGQDLGLDDVASRALDVGAANAHVLDVRKDFVKNFCYKALKAGARYEERYLMSAALSRPLIATELVRIAHEEGASSIAHGAPQTGNDQFRLECSVAALDPTLNLVAPLREWGMRSRKEVLDYARRNRLEFVSKNDVYSRDVNLWGARCAGGPLVDISKEAPEDAHLLTASPTEAPDEPEDITITFNKGEPTRLNGKTRNPVDMLTELNQIAGRHGVGRLDFIENSHIGFKKREVYESPGATVLHSAHDAIERFVLDKQTLRVKRTLASAYADAVYSGMWFSTLRESLEAFVKVSQEYVSGEVVIRLYKGTASAITGNSQYSTYDREILSLDGGEGLPEGAAEGMLAIARILQHNRAFKQKPRT